MVRLLRRPRACSAALLALPFCAACRPAPGPDEDVRAEASVRAVLAAERQRNVTLVVVDGLRADHVGAWGQALPTTPAIDRLAERGWRVADAMTPAPWSAPALAALLGGRYPTRLGWADPAAEPVFDEAMLPARLARAGWTTAAVVSHEFVGAEQGFGAGFDHFVEVGLAREDESPADVAPHRRSAAAVTARALDLVDRMGAEPWFLLVHYADPLPGWPRIPGFDFTRPNYDGAVVDGGDWREVLRRAGEYDDDDRAHLAALYAGEVAATDREIGRLVEGLEERGRFTAGWFVLTATAGVELFDHGGLGDQRTLYDELVHVPLIAVGPGLAPRRVDTTASLVDVAPTLCAWLELPRWDGYDGAVLDPDALWSERVLYTETDRARKLRGVTRGSWKLIEDREKQEHELFELRTDPDEGTNLAPRQDGRREDLEGLLEGFFGPMEPAGD